MAATEVETITKDLNLNEELEQDGEEKDEEISRNGEATSLKKKKKKKKKKKGLDS